MIFLFPAKPAALGFRGSLDMRPVTIAVAGFCFFGRIVTSCSFFSLPDQFSVQIATLWRKPPIIKEYGNMKLLLIFRAIKKIQRTGTGGPVRWIDHGVFVVCCYRSSVLKAEYPS